MNIELISEAVVAPCIERAPFEVESGGRWSGIFGGGIYCGDRYLPIGVERYGVECLLNGAPMDPPSAQESYAQAAFGGYIFKHYGHFVLESTARLWIRRLFPHLPLVFTTHEPEADLYSQQLDLLELFAPYIIIKQCPVFVEELLLPTPCFVMGSPLVSIKDHRWIAEKVSFASRGNGELPYENMNVYLARGRGQRRTIEGETKLCEMLSDLGFKIISPETLPLREQVAIFLNAKTIVSPLGSAWHTLNLARAPKYQRRVYIDMFDKLDDTYLIVEQASDGSPFHRKLLEPAPGSVELPYSRTYTMDPIAVKDYVCEVIRA